MEDNASDPKKKRSMLVLLRLDVIDLDDNTRRELAHDMDIPVEDLETLEDCSPFEVANVLDGIAGEGIREDLFAGSDTYVTFADATVLLADWER